MKNNLDKNYLIYGIHPIRELIKKGYTFKKAFIQKNINSNLKEDLIVYCKKKKINFFFEEKKKINDFCPGANHQGFVIECKSNFSRIENLEHYLEKKLNSSFSIILILDQITDPQNLGSITRTAYYFGCDLIILEEKNSSPINQIVHKVSSGASFLIPFYISKKISRAIKVLKEKKYKIIGTTVNEEKSTSLLVNNTFSHSPLDSKKKTLIIGSEGEGIRPHLLREIDQAIHIPRGNPFNSLNVGVVSGIVLYEMSRQKNTK